MFKNAGKAEILRSHQKDNFYLTYLRGLVADVVHNLIGPRQWIRWRKEVDVIADIGYFLLTTVSGFQTIGEEYVSILQMEKTRRNIPSAMRRCLMVVLHILMPYLVRKLLDWLERRVQAQEEHVMPVQTRDFLLRCIPAARTAVLYVHRLHMAVFYMNGIYYHIAKNVTGVKYVQYNVKPGTEEDGPVSTSFRVLGWLTLAQLLGSGSLTIYKSVREMAAARHKTDRKKSTASTDIVSSDRKCCLCLEERKHSSATPCGHLFCWTCIQEWCCTKNECPLCREKIEQNRIVCLQNFDPV